MKLSELVAYVQSRFGDEGRPENPARPPVPGWIQNSAGFAPTVALEDQQGNLRIVTLEPEDSIGIEGDGQGFSGPLTDKDLGEWSTDALAYYLPFHFYKSRWGIYLRASGIAYLAQKLKQAYPSASDPRYLEVARHVLYEHEFFHFHTETAASIAEVGRLKNLYRGYFADTPAADHEEAMANAQAFRSLNTKKHRLFRDSVHDWMSNQPGGYGKFLQWVLPEEFKCGRRAIGAKIIDPTQPLLAEEALLASTPWPIEGLFQVHIQASVRKHIPTYLVRDVPLPWMGILRPFAKHNGVCVVVHTRNEHPPPHIHVFMPPDKELGSYCWPDLTPVWSGKPALTGRQRSALRTYLDRYGHAVNAKVQAVFGSLSNSHG